MLVYFRTIRDTITIEVFDYDRISVECKDMVNEFGIWNLEVSGKENLW